MPAFRSTPDLPSVLTCGDWSWSPYEAGKSKPFWLGTDAEGTRWLTKMRGGFNAYREIVFARLAQRAGWSCQSSTFAVLDPTSPPMRFTRSEDQVQLLSLFVEEHPSTACGVDCPLPRLQMDLAAADDRAMALQRTSILGALDWARADVAAALLGANEPSGGILTRDHRHLIIDSELMFSTGPTDPRVTDWYECASGAQSNLGSAITREVCMVVGSLADSDIEELLLVPSGVHIAMSWSIGDRLRSARDFAFEFVRTNTGERRA